MIEKLKKIKYHLNINQNDVSALIDLNKIVKIYLPWTSSAVNPAALKMMINEIMIHDKKSIIELGSGISTVFFEVLAREKNIKIYSVDSDQVWQEKVKKMIIDNNGDPNNVNFIFAPLIKYQDDFFKGKFYNLDENYKLFQDNKFDFLFVDGPISQIGAELTRYPALVKLFPYLKDFVIFLHDASRVGEKKIAEKWAKDFELKLIDYSIQTNMFCLRKLTSNYYNIL